MPGLTSQLLSDEKNHRITGFCLMACAGLFITLGNVLVQFIHNEYKAFSSFEMLLYRRAFQLIFSIVFMISRKVHPYGDKKINLFKLFIMGVAEVSSNIFFYLSLQLIPVADATIVQFTSPVFTVFFSFLLLHKGCGVIELLCGCVSFFGVVVISKPDLIFSQPKHSTINQLNNHIVNLSKYKNSQYLPGCMYALLAALCLSLYFISNKLNGLKVDLTFTVFYPSLLGVVIAPIGIAVKHDQVLYHQIKAEHWYIIAVIGFVEYVGLMLMSESLQLEDSGPLVLIRNCNFIYAFLLQYLLTNKLPSPTALLGTIVILGATSVLIIHRLFNLQQYCCNECCGHACANKNQIQVEEEEKNFLLTK